MEDWVKRAQDGLLDKFIKLLLSAATANYSTEDHRVVEVYYVFVYYYNTEILLI